MKFKSTEIQKVRVIIEEMISKIDEEKGNLLMPIALNNATEVLESIFISSTNFIVYYEADQENHFTKLINEKRIAADIRSTLNGIYYWIDYLIQKGGCGENTQPLRKEIKEAFGQIKQILLSS